MSLLKLPLLLSSAIFFDIALDRPYPPQPDDKVIVTSKAREGVWRHAALPSSLFLKATAYLTAVGESIVILGSLYDTGRSGGPISVFLNALGPAEASRLTVPFVLGAFLVTVGGYARLKCFRALGPYFTFVQCIRKDHKLVTTGPYAVVRHPGYISLLVCIVGSGIMHGSPGAWLRTSGFLDVLWVRVVVVSWCLIMGASIVTVCSRTTEEDRFLKEKFGEEWKDWARRVRYKFVPFVY